MIDGLILQIIAGSIGIYLASHFVPRVSLQIIPGQSEFFGIEFTETWQLVFLIGMVLGFINFFIKPILKIITLPLTILTFGLFSLVVNMALIWVVDIIFPELTIQGVSPLFWTTIIVWGATFFLGVQRLKD
jgi:putative membrane protein